LSYREPWWLVESGKESDETAGSGRRDGVKLDPRSEALKRWRRWWCDDEVRNEFGEAGRRIGVVKRDEHISLRSLLRGQGRFLVEDGRNLLPEGVVEAEEKVGGLSKRSERTLL
jgi:hypothetical protein